MLTAAFIIGSAFLTVGLSQNHSDQFVLLILYAVATAMVSLFLGACFAKNQHDADWYMQIAGAAGGAFTTLMVPFYLNTWYGEDYSMMWVLWTVILNVLLAYYVYYDLFEYQGESLIEENDYIYATLRVYMDWIWIIFYWCLKTCWKKTMSSEHK
jgi:predicted permease